MYGSAQRDALCRYHRLMKNNTANKDGYHLVFEDVKGFSLILCKWIFLGPWFEFSSRYSAFYQGSQWVPLVTWCFSGKSFFEYVDIVTCTLARTLNDYFNVTYWCPATFEILDAGGIGNMMPIVGYSTQNCKLTMYLLRTRVQLN